MTDAKSEYSVEQIAARSNTDDLESHRDRRRQAIEETSSFHWFAVHCKR